MARSAQNDVLEKFRFGATWFDSGNTPGDLFDATGNLKTGLIRAGFTDIQMPKRATNVIMYREGIDADVQSKSAGLSTFEDLVFGRGLLSDATSTREFNAWSRLVHDAGVYRGSFGFQSAVDDSRKASGSLDYRKEVIIWMYNRSGKIVRAWHLFNAWPSNIVTGSDLNSNEDGEKSLEQLTLTYEDMFELAFPSGGIDDVPSDITPAGA